MLCAPDGEADERPLSIEVSAGLDFARIAAPASGDATVAVDPRSAERSIGGGAVGLGGFPLAGEVVVRGTPGRPIRIDMPREADLATADGRTVHLIRIETDLGPAPRLDAGGMLRFRFGGVLLVKPGTGGLFRGRIPITANYL